MVSKDCFLFNPLIENIRRGLNFKIIILLILFNSLNIKIEEMGSGYHITDKAWTNHSEESQFSAHLILHIASLSWFQLLLGERACRAGQAFKMEFQSILTLFRLMGVKKPELEKYMDL